MKTEKKKYQFVENVYRKLFPYMTFLQLLTFTGCTELDNKKPEIIYFNTIEELIENNFFDGYKNPIFLTYKKKDISHVYIRTTINGKLTILGKVFYNKKRNNSISLKRIRELSKNYPK